MAGRWNSNEQSENQSSKSVAQSQAIHNTEVQEESEYIGDTAESRNAVRPRMEISSLESSGSQPLAAHWNHLGRFIF